MEDFSQQVADPNYNSKLSLAGNIKRCIIMIFCMAIGLV